MKKTYQHYPFLTKRSLLTAFGSYLVLMFIPVIFYLTPTIGLKELTPTVALFVTLFFAEYYVLFIIPYVLFIRITGRFLHMPLRYRVRGIQPFTPFHSHPLEYGARPYGGLVSFLVSTLLLFIFLIFAVMPTIYYLFS